MWLNRSMWRTGQSAAKVSMIIMRPPQQQGRGVHRQLSPEALPL
jgi:hypothetical protein